MAFSTTPTLLATKTTYDTTSFDLSDNIHNYDYIMVCMACQWSNHPYYLLSTFAPTSLITSNSIAVDASRFSDSDTYAHCSAEIQFASDGTHANLMRTQQRSITFKWLKIFGLN